MAFVGALSAMASCDGAASIEEVLEVLARVDLSDLTPEGLREAWERVLAPPSVEASAASLAGLSAGLREEVAAQLLGVAHVDGELVPAEVEALGKAQVALGLDDRAMARAARRVANGRWEREHGIARADALDNLRNGVVAAAGFGAPVGAILWLGLLRQADPRLAIAAGVEALGLGYGFVAGILVAMAVSVAASALASGLTLRGRRSERIRRELLERSRRVRANLPALVEHVGEQVRRSQFGDGPRVGSVALANRYQALEQTLARLPSAPDVD